MKRFIAIAGIAGALILTAQLVTPEMYAVTDAPKGKVVIEKKEETHPTITDSALLSGCKTAFNKKNKMGAQILRDDYQSQIYTLKKQAEHKVKEAKDDKTKNKEQSTLDVLKWILANTKEAKGTKQESPQ
jgi:hypothetical protein